MKRNLRSKICVQIFGLLNCIILTFASAHAGPPSPELGKKNSTVGSLDYQSVQAEGGRNLRYRKIRNGYLLVLVPGQEIMQSLTAFQKQMHIKFATVTGLGDVEKVQITHFNSKTKTMDVAAPETAKLLTESNELSSLICTLSTLDRDPRTGEPAPLAHCHATIGLSAEEGNRVVGGHLISATVSVVGEILITTYRQDIFKTHDAPFNGNLFDLNDLDAVPAVLSDPR